MDLAPGGMLAHYSLVEKIGEGGMGVVWRAVDTKLERDVAIKILPEGVAGDPERLARFDREAKLLAALNHPHIAAVYGLDEAEGLRFLVMELVAGEDLARRLTRGPLDVDEVLSLARQLAGALSAAHDRGIVHRDLKPANVVITEDGKAKVLDFGLAKVFEAEDGGADPALSPTITSAGSRAGMILGTAAYMSPEQARGRPVDRRTDIWSFGCLVFECLSGRRAFAGSTVSDILASVLKSPPDWSALPAGTPPRLRELLDRCLEKDVRKRLRDIGDARLDLVKASSGEEFAVSTSGVAPAPAARASGRWPRVVALVGALLIGAVVGIAFWNSPLGARLGLGRAAHGVTSVSVMAPEGLIPSDVRISADGRMLAFRGRPETGDATEPRRLFLRRLDRYDSVPVEGSAGARSHVFSPDGRWVAFVAPIAPSSSELRLIKASVDGTAPPLVLTDWEDSWGTELVWTARDEIVTVTLPPQQLIRIPADGSPAGPPVAVDAGDYDGAFWLWSALPDGEDLLATGFTYRGRGFRLCAGLIDATTGKARILIEDGTAPVWSPTGHLLFTRGDALLAVPFDLESGTISGGAATVVGGMRTRDVWSGASFDLSVGGTLVYRPGGIQGARRRIVIGDLDGNFETWPGEPRAYEDRVTVSSDGRWLAAQVVNDVGLYEIWGSEIARPRLRRLAAEPDRDCSAIVWHPDSERIVYKSFGHTGTTEIFMRRVDSDDEPDLLMHSKSLARALVPRSISPDGSWLLVVRASGGKYDTLLLPLEPGLREAELLIEDAVWPVFSPDGRWIAYESMASGRSEVYLRSFRPPNEVGPEIPVSTTGGAGPEWPRGARGPGLELIYSDTASSHLAAVSISVEPTLSISPPRYLKALKEPGEKKVGYGEFMPDGRWIAIFRGEDEVVTGEIRVVFDWFDELRRKVSTP